MSEKIKLSVKVSIAAVLVTVLWLGAVVLFGAGQKVARVDDIKDDICALQDTIKIVETRLATIQANQVHMLKSLENQRQTLKELPLHSHTAFSENIKVDTGS